VTPVPHITRSTGEENFTQGFCGETEGEKELGRSKHRNKLILD
jgi:hypothetical protein